MLYCVLSWRASCARHSFWSAAVAVAETEEVEVMEITLGKDNKEVIKMPTLACSLAGAWLVMT